MTDPIERFKVVFFEEAAEAIDAIENNLLTVDGSEVDPETINDIFRAAHSLKGGSATFGMTVLTDFTHVMETLLDLVRAGSMGFSQAIIDCLFSSLDVLRNLVGHYQFDDDVDQERADLVRGELEKLMAGDGLVSDEPIAAATETETEASSSSGWDIQFVPHANIMDNGNDPLRYLDEVLELGQHKVSCDVSKVPDFEALDPTQFYLSWQIELQPEEQISQADLSDIFMWVEDECDLKFEAINNTQTTEPQVAQAEPVAAEVAKPVIAQETPGTATPAPAPAKSTKGDSKTKANQSRASQSIRVDLEKIDSLINLLGELVITQSMLSIFGDSEKYPQFERLSNGLGQLERHTRDLQEGVMRIRMLPISFCFSRFPRMVRDLGKQLNKELVVEIIGEHTEVDKTVIEELTDPLVHLVRNSVDHGIEMPDVRVANGKPATGTITLKAFHQVGNIIIEIADDGAGLNTQKIKEKAISAEVISEHAEMTDQEINELIFAPGFSTADAVTDLSGRGVGMDVVKRNIQSLGGSIEVKSEPGKGSVFTIRLPLTLAILDGQLVRVCDQTYIIPLLSIIESIQVDKQQLNVISDKEVTFKWRDEYIPLIKLHSLFKLETQERRVEDGLVVVVEGDGKKCGLYVDELTTHQQVVVKSLEANYKKVSGISGATILGDGSVALILDIATLINRSRSL